MGTSPVSLRPEDTTAIYTVCVIYLAKGGVRIICTGGLSRAGKRPQVSVSCENLLAVKSTYTLWNPLTCLHCFITRSVVWGELSLNDTVELLLAIQKLSFASEIDLSVSFLLALPLKPPAAVCRHLLPSCNYICVSCVCGHHPRPNPNPNPGMRGVPSVLSQKGRSIRGVALMCRLGTDAGFKSFSICWKGG